MWHAGLTREGVMKIIKQETLEIQTTAYQIYESVSLSHLSIIVKKIHGIFCK